MRRPADLLRTSLSGAWAGGAAPVATEAHDQRDEGAPAPPADRVAAARGLEQLVRTATLLVGDQDLAQRLVAEVAAGLPRSQRLDALATPDTPTLWPPLVAEAQLLDARLASAAMADVVAAPLATRPPGEARRPNHREVRWALLGTPMAARAVVVLDAAGVRHDVLAGALALSPAELDEARAAARARLAGALAVDAGAVTGLVAAARHALRVDVDDAALTALAERPRTVLPATRRRDALRTAAVVLALAGALVWLAQREPARRSTLPVGDVPRMVIDRPTTTAARAPQVLGVATARDIGAVAPIDAPTVTASPAAGPAPITAAGAPPGPAAAEGPLPSLPAPTGPAPLGPPAGTTPPATGSATTAPPTTAPPATAPPTNAPPTDAPPGTDPPRPATTPSPTTAAPTTAPAAPPVTAPPVTAPAPAPTTTAAPAFTKLAIASASCSRLLLSASFTVTGVTDRSTPDVEVSTPYGRYRTTAVPTSGTSASWTVSAWVPLALTSDATVTASSGAQTVSSTMTC